MTCVEAAVAFIDRLDVPSELEEEASNAYSAYDDHMKGNVLRRNISKQDLNCDAERDTLAKRDTNISSGNLAGMVEDDGILNNGTDANPVIFNC